MCFGDQSVAKTTCGKATNDESTNETQRRLPARFVSKVGCLAALVFHHGKKSSTLSFDLLIYLFLVRVIVTTKNRRHWAQSTYR
mmetsp:Transcript_15113/g.22154  ORF Transcript_15113/g.22154 Transcript_15113/m.22154 type:complete len:84 (+) Transcript_15113:14-265(+)